MLIHPAHLFQTVICKQKWVPFPEDRACGLPRGRIELTQVAEKDEGIETKTATEGWRPGYRETIQILTESQESSRVLGLAKNPVKDLSDTQSSNQLGDPGACGGGAEVASLQVIGERYQVADRWTLIQRKEGDDVEVICMTQSEGGDSLKAGE